jgi:hypothetical protein
MSTCELERVEVMGRVAEKELKLIDAAAMLQLSYRQVKRLWRRYRKKGSQGLQHGNLGRVSNRSKPVKFRRRVLSLIRRKYSGSEQERFGPTLAAEHLAEEEFVMIPYLAGLLAMVLVSRSSDRQIERKFHTAIPAIDCWNCLGLAGCHSFCFFFDCLPIVRLHRHLQCVRSILVDSE